MADENIKLAILFADIANSTRLYDILGNNAARDLIGDCLALLRKATESHKGTVIKTIGDEIMCTFQNADDAVDAAIDMNRDLVNMKVRGLPDTFPPNIYVGIQHGPVIKEDNDVFGDAVNVAAHMVTLAKQRQIITTEDTFGLLSPEHKASARLIDKTTIKSKSGEINIYEILWEQKDETIMLDETLDSLIIETHMELKYHHQIVIIDKNLPIVTFGRQSHNDLVVDDIMVSRTHARIEYRRGKFFLIDQSTNGTYTQPRDGKTTKLKREETFLNGNGSISLGRKIDSSLENKNKLISFKIKY